MKNEIKGSIFVILSGILGGGSFVLVAISRNLGIGPLTQSVVRNLFASSLVIMFLYLFRKKDLKVNKKVLFQYFLIGLIVAMENLTSFSAIAINTPVALVSFLFNIQPIITAYLSVLILKEKVTKNLIYSLIVGTFGIFLISGVNFFNISFSNLIGIILSIMAALLFSGEIILARKLGIKDTNPFVNFSYSYFFAAIINFCFFPFLNLLSPFFKFKMTMPLQNYIFLFFVAIYSIFFISCFYLGVKYIKASTTSILLFFQPISASLFGYFILKETIGYQVLSGGLLLLISVFTVTKHKKF